MSTIGYSSWAVDLAEVGAVYPFQGLEGLMLFLGLAFWIIWQVCMSLAESKQLEQDESSTSTDDIKKAIEHH